MQRTRELGLREQAIAYCVLLLLGTVTILSGTLIYRNHKVTMAKMRQNALVDALTLSHGVEPSILGDDRESLTRFVNSAARDRMLRVAEILGPDGEILAQFNRDVSFKPRFETPHAETFAAKSRQIETSSRQLQVRVPIQVLDTEAGETGEVIGLVHLVYSLDQIYADLRHNILSSLLIGVSVLAFGNVVTVLLVRRFIRPMNSLVNVTGEIAAGELSKRASEEAVGEIGHLAKSFNHMAETLQVSYESIENKVRKRTEELVRANRAKSDFLANMSHEIRTPMTAILGFAENLLDAKLAESEKKQAIQTIRKNGNHLLQIINDILDLTKIEAGRMKVEHINCSPLQVVCEAASLMRARAEAKCLQLGIELDGAIPETIQSDPTRLRQILINLVSNALKFTRSGSVRIVTSLVRPPQGDPVLKLDVVDTGIGMSQEQIARIFAAFTQADETMTRKFGGTGLGLTISKHLARRLGGDVTVRSQAGKGSTFTLTVAAGDIEGVRMIDQATEAMLPPKGKVEPKMRNTLSHRILFAEDGVDNQRLISHVLRRAGAEVEIAENGSVAVEKALEAQKSGHPFDVILMDMQMPVLDGYLATRELRSKGYAGPIIALTAHAMDGDRDRCLEAGCDEYETKPIDRQRLISKMLRLIEKKAARQPVAVAAD